MAAQSKHQNQLFDQENNVVPIRFDRQSSNPTFRFAEAPKESPSGSFSAVYAFNKDHFRKLAGNNSTVSQTDALSAVLQQYGVQLISVGCIDPDSKDNERDFTICAKDPKTLGAAMVKLSELGLPFKKRIDNWYSGKSQKVISTPPTRNKPQTTSSNAGDSLGSSPFPEDTSSGLHQGMGMYRLTTSSRDFQPGASAKTAHFQGREGEHATTEHREYANSRSSSASSPGTTSRKSQVAKETAQQSVAQRAPVGHNLKAGISSRPTFPTDSRVHQYDGLYGSVEQDNTASPPVLPFSSTVPARGNILANMGNSEKFRRGASNTELMERAVERKADDAIQQMSFRRLNMSPELPKLRVDTSVNSSPAASENKVRLSRFPRAPPGIPIPLENSRLYGHQSFQLPEPSVATEPNWGAYTAASEKHDPSYEFPDEAPQLFYPSKVSYPQQWSGAVESAMQYPGSLLPQSGTLPTAEASEYAACVAAYAAMQSIDSSFGPAATSLHVRPPTQLLLRSKDVAAQALVGTPESTQPAAYQTATGPVPVSMSGQYYPTGFADLEQNHSNRGRNPIPRQQPRTTATTTSVYTLGPAAEMAQADATMGPMGEAYFSYRLKPPPLTGPRFIR